MFPVRGEGNGGWRGLSRTVKVNVQTTIQRPASYPTEKYVGDIVKTVRAAAYEKLCTLEECLFFGPFYTPAGYGGINCDDYRCKIEIDRRASRN